MSSPQRFTIAFVLCTLACAPRTSRPAPTPQPSIPSPPTPTQPSATPPLSRAFHYAAGSHRYILTSDATLSVQTDSVRPPLESQTTTRTIYSLSIDTTTQPPRITGAVDSFTVQRGSRIPVPVDSTLQLPLHWSSTLGRASSSAESCSIAGELITAAQDLLPHLPGNLEDGRRWREETTRSVCRADIPVTISAVHEYRVTGPAAFENDSVLQVTRTTTAKLSGQRHQNDKVISLKGTGSGVAQLYVNPRTGQLVGRTEEARTELEIETPRGRTRLSQDARSQLARQKGQ